MTTQSVPNCTETDKKTSKLRFQDIMYPFKLLGKVIFSTNEFIKGYTELLIAIFAILATIGVGYASHNATLEAAKISSSTSLKSHLDAMNSILHLERNSEQNPILRATGVKEENMVLLRSNSFAALRDLEGNDKGTLIRFLAENHLINSEQPIVVLAGADLRHVDLEDAWLPDISLQKAYILDGNLVNTDLTRANLRNAVLKRVDLTGAILKDTDFTNADLEGAFLNVDEALESGAVFCGAIMPDGEKFKCR
jgi:uncharacterized protein YjbI with pentapeptide repeats